MVGDVQWTTKSLQGMILLGFFAGMMSSMLGLGGGVIYNPIFISFKIFPQVAFSTGMYLAIYTTLANSILFLIANQLVVSWALY